MLTLHLSVLNSPAKVFAFVYTNLLEQGPARNKDGSCRYRTADNRKCAVGQIVPDSIYHVSMEGHGLGSIIRDGYFPLELMSYSKLLGALQDIHDQAVLTNTDSSDDEWRAHFKFGCKLFLQFVRGRHQDDLNITTDLDFGYFLDDVIDLVDGNKDKLALIFTQAERILMNTTPA